MAREGGEAGWEYTPKRPHGWEADLPGCTLRREESEEEEYGERLWLDIVFEKLSFLLLFTVASLLCYGILVGK